IKKHQPGRVIDNWLSERLPMLFGVALPSRWLLIFLPVGLLAINRPRAVVLLVLPLMIAIYTFWTFFLPHYGVLAAPAFLLLVLLAARAIQESFPVLRTMMPLILFAFALVGFSEINPDARDGPPIEAMPTMKLAYEGLPKTITTPAVVLFRAHPEN